MTREAHYLTWLLLQIDEMNHQCIEILFYDFLQKGVQNTLLASSFNLFRPHRNPVTFSLISVILVLYCGLLVLCRHADRHDAKKGGIVYLLDNTPMDQQKYELTIETGFRKGAGTSAKVRHLLIP